jgi:hypothetical protein
MYLWEFLNKKEMRKNVLLAYCSLNEKSDEKAQHHLKQENSLDLNISVVLSSSFK